MFEPERLFALSGFGDPFSALTHLAGAIVFATLAVSLVRGGRGVTHHRVSLAVFAAACVLMLAISGTYHLLQPGLGRDQLQRLDHAAIFLLIAGSFTPVHAYLFRGPWRWGMLAGIWSLALAGVGMKLLYFSAIPEWLGLLSYLGLGWLGLVSWTMLLRRHGFRAVRMALWGALAYTAGALVDFLRWPELVPGLIGAHELFHLAVLAGISCHWTFIYGFAAGQRRDAWPERYAAARSA